MNGPLTVPWWGAAWIDAVEQRALVSSRLPRGRAYAASGRVREITIEPGTVRASVMGSRPEAYRARLDVRVFTDDEWRRLFEVIVGKAVHAAALADGQLDPSLVDDAEAVGVHLLPQPGDLTPSCSCPDSANPCKHAAALAFRVAELLDADPFVLLVLRGRTGEQVVAAVRRLRTEAAAATSATPAGTGGGPGPGGAVEAGGGQVGGDTAGHDRPRAPVDEGVEAGAAWERRIAPLPSAPHLRIGPVAPSAQPIEPPRNAAFTARGLATLASDAAERAWTALATGASLGLDAGFDDDVVRRSITATQQPGFADVAQRLGTSAGALARRAAAWEVGGEAGLAMANEGTWPADPLTMSAARLAVEEVLRGHIRGDIDDNRLTIGDVQLRLSRTGQWWAFRQEGTNWLLADGPVDAADELVEPRPGRRR